MPGYPRSVIHLLDPSLWNLASLFRLCAISGSGFAHLCSLWPLWHTFLFLPCHIPTFCSPKKSRYTHASNGTPGGQFPPLLSWATFMSLLHSVSSTQFHEQWPKVVLTVPSVSRQTDFMLINSYLWKLTLENLHIFYLEMQIFYIPGKCSLWTSS